MSEWKSGEPTEDGWYWVILRGKATMNFWYINDRQGSDELPCRGWRFFEGATGNWQGPLTTPDPPSSVLGGR